MGIVYEARQHAILAHRQVPFDGIKANVAGVNQAVLVSLLDIVEQLF